MAVLKELYDLLQENDPLEDYINAFEDNLGDDSILRSLADRIGVWIPDREDALYVLYDQLKRYLESYPDIRETQKLINISPTEYRKHLEDISEANSNLSEESFQLLYSNRLLEKFY